MYPLRKRHQIRLLISTYKKIFFGTKKISKSLSFTIVTLKQEREKRSWKPQAHETHF